MAHRRSVEYSAAISTSADSETLILDDLLDFLESVGTEETEHTHGSLRSHLRGTYDTLAHWGCPEAVCRAGLFHSVYGTEMFQKTTIPLDERSAVQTRIGLESERLVHLYALLRRASLYENLDRGWPYAVALRDDSSEPLSREEFVGLMTIDVANRLEQTHGPLGDADRTIYRKAIPLLPQLAVTDLGTALAHSRPRLEGLRALARRVPMLRRLKRALVRRGS
jgi:hypothetical protein